MRQREKPMATPEQLAATFNIPVSGIRCSGGMIDQEPFDSVLWFKSIVIFWLALLVGVSLVWVTK